MTERVLITRPREQALSLRTRLALRGIGGIVAPMLRIMPLKAASLVPDHYQAVLFTSATAVRHLPYDGLPPEWGSWPCYCVGTATAQAARDHGWRQIRHGHGGGAALAALLRESVSPESGTLLHPCGQERKPEPGDSLITQGYHVQSWEVYRAEAATQWNAQTVLAMQQGMIAVALFYSTRTLEVFARLMRHSSWGDTRSRRMTALCLSPAQAAEARTLLPWRAVHHAPSPQDEAMLIGLQNLLRR